MPNHIAQRIALLRKLISEGLHESNLDKLVVECDALSQDSSQVAVFFVLKHIFAELSSAIDGQPVTVAAHSELTEGISDQVLRLLDTVQRDHRVGPDEVEELIAAHLRNLNVFRSS